MQDSIINKKIQKLDMLTSTIVCAGRDLKKSAYYEIASYGCAAAGTALACSAVTAKKTSTRDALLISGGIFGVAGIICQIYSISFKLNSGKYLHYYGNKLVMDF